MNEYFGMFSENKTKCESVFFRKEIESAEYKEPTITHSEQLNSYNVPIVLEYLSFIFNQTQETILGFQNFLINFRNTNNTVQYLQNCYVNNTLYVHDQYFPPDTEIEIYREIQ